MIRSDEYVRHDGLALAGLVRRREVSAVELVQAAIARIESRPLRIALSAATILAWAYLRVRDYGFHADTLRFLR